MHNKGKFIVKSVRSYYDFDERDARNQE